MLTCILTAVRVNLVAVKPNSYLLHPNNICAHSRAPELLASDGFWNPKGKCRFVAVPCKELSYSSFEYQTFTECSAVDARPLATIIGINDKKFPKPSKEFANYRYTFSTTDIAPFCQFNIIFKNTVDGYLYLHSIKGLPITFDSSGKVTEGNERLMTVSTMSLIGELYREHEENVFQQEHVSIG